MISLRGAPEELVPQPARQVAISVRAKAKQRVENGNVSAFCRERDGFI
jgi:hypothetical protein